jgi:peptidoglycan-associated lipoprotein
MSYRHFVLFAAFVLAACGKKAPETVPPPDTGDRTPTSTTGSTVATPAGGTTTRPADTDAAATTADLTRLMLQPIYFDLDQDAIKAEAQSSLDQKAAILLANPGLRIRIAGHADERGSDEYNIVLGNRRATSAKRYLETKGIDASRIETISYGEERPVDSAASESAWARNRRDEFEITSGGDRLVKPQ